MTGTPLKVLKAFLWFVCAFHVLVGLGLNIWPDFPQIMAGYYGAQADWTPQFVYILKPLGVFMLALGILAAAAARNPLSHTVVIYAFVVVFVLRALHRFLLWPVIRDVFEIPAARNFSTGIFFLVLAGVLLLLLQLANRGRSRTPAMST